MSAADTLRLNCPKCHTAVRVRTAAVGKRVRCPQCQAEFKVPGQAGTAPPVDPPAEDDWLNLDQPLPPFDKTPPPPARPQSGGPQSGGSRSSGQSFTDADLAALSGALDQAGWGDDHLPPVAGETPADPAAESEFRVTCPVCGSITYARRDQVGKAIHCHDCHSPFKVPPPPRPKPKYKPNLDQAEAYSLKEAGEERDYDRGPMAKSAADLLREAEASDEEDEPVNQYDNPDVVGWLKGIFRIFVDPAVPAHWIMLSLVGAVPGMVAVAVGHPSLIAAAAAGSLLYGAFVLACGFSILEAVANGEPRVSEWPYMDPAEWLGRLFMVLAATALAGGPGAMLGALAFGPGMGAVALTMLSIYVLFPFVLMSMLDSESVFMPFSAEVSKSVTRCQDAWGVLYLSAGLLFFFLFIVYAAGQLMPPMAAVLVDVFATVGAVFTYFAMIGQLAYAIGHSVNAPPMKNDIQQQRDAEHARKTTPPQ